MALWYKIFKEFSAIFLSFFNFHYTCKSCPPLGALKKDKNVFVFFKYFVPPKNILTYNNLKVFRMGLGVTSKYIGPDANFSDWPLVAAVRLHQRTQVDAYCANPLSEPLWLGVGYHIPEPRSPAGPNGYSMVV